MAISVTHATVVLTPDDGTSEVGTNEWNASHTVDLGTGDTQILFDDNAVLGGSDNLKFDKTNVNLSIGGTTSSPSLFAISSATDVTAGRWAFRGHGYGSSATGPAIALTKSRGAGPSDQGVVQNNDVVGSIDFLANDGGGHDPCARIRAIIDGTPGTDDLPARLVFLTSPDGNVVPTERMRIGAAGNITVGATAATFSATVMLDIHSATGSQFTARMAGFGNDVGGSQLILSKTRGTDINTNTIVNNGDRVGEIRWYAADGTNYVEAASITASIDNAPGTNDMPGRLVFSTTADGSSGVSERLRIDSTGQIIIRSGTATPAGGSTGVRLVFGSTAGFGIYIGSGAPTVSAAQGSLYLRSDGSSTNNRAYINTNGSTTWTALTTVA